VPGRRSVLTPDAVSRNAAGGQEGVARLEVAVASRVADQVPAAGGAVELRQGVGPALRRLAVAGPPAGPDRLDLLPQRRRHERRPVAALAGPQSPGVQRRGEHPPDGEEREAAGGRDGAVRQTGGRKLERPAHERQRVRVSLEELRRRVAPEAERRVAARVALRGELRRVALADPPAVLAQPGLGRLRLVDQLVPVPLVRREDLLVAEPHGDAPGCSWVHKGLEDTTQVGSQRAT